MQAMNGLPTFEMSLRDNQPPLVSFNPFLLFLRRYLPKLSASHFSLDHFHLEEDSHMAETFRGRIYDDITQCIGNTPLIRLRRVVGAAKGIVLAKMENFNPLWSVKDRIGVSMIEAGERDGKIN